MKRTWSPKVGHCPLRSCAGGKHVTNHLPIHKIARLADGKGIRIILIQHNLEKFHEKRGAQSKFYLRSGDSVIASLEQENARIGHV